jgi:UDP-2,4-diacetamido-2,4,6-trideoxy-beta-L-altropyranose hydrolase
MSAERDVCRIAFRVDASTQIGTGHFMRCLTLADALCQRGATVHFIARHLPQYLEAMLADRDMACTRIGSAGDPAASGGLAHAVWLGTTQEVDAAQSRNALGDMPWNWLIVDHYALDLTWERAIRPRVQKIAAIDDIADRIHDCDLLIDQNFHEDATARYRELVPAHCRLLLGPGYAMLRSEFSRLRQKTKLRCGGVNRILVFFGGVDAANMTSFAIQALALVKLDGMEVDVVVGAHHPCLSELRTLCGELGYRCYVQTDKMADMMLGADLAIGAAGSASWERCCLGLPALLFSLADNQIGIAQAIERLGAGRYVGGVSDVTMWQFAQLVSSVCSMPEWLLNMSSKAFAVTDGGGVFRVCSQLVSDNENIHSLH